MTSTCNHCLLEVGPLDPLKPCPACGKPACPWCRSWHSRSGFCALTTRHRNRGVKRNYHERLWHKPESVIDSLAKLYAVAMVPEEAEPCP
jgi:hypothetical protein